MVINVDPKSNGLHKAYFTRAGNKGCKYLVKLSIPIGTCNYKDESDIFKVHKSLTIEHG